MKVRRYGDGFSFSDDACPCGRGAVAVVPDEKYGALTFEQHVAGCKDEDLAARALLWVTQQAVALGMSVSGDDDEEGR